MTNGKDKAGSYGPENPHPLSRMRTELVWEGKYDEWGNRRSVNQAECAMPMQRIETVDEPRSRAEYQGELDLFDKQVESRTRDNFRNRLIWGDNKLVMASLLQEFKGKIDLIYIDPPFDVGADFTMDVPIGDEKETVAKDQSTLEMVAYRDTWGKGTDSYLHMLFERVTLMRELLSDKGSIFLHVGSEIASCVRLLMDDSFGKENFRNEIILPGRAIKNLQQQFDSIMRLQVRHDMLLWYSKKSESRFLPFWVSKHDPGNPEGHWHHFWSTANRPTMRYELFGITPRSGQWVWKKERALKAVQNYERFQVERCGRSLVEYWRDTGGVLEFIRKSSDDGKPQYWREPAESRLGDTVWSGTPIYSADNDYPTEKNEKLLEEVLRLASNDNDLVADFFCGSGTTGAVAERLGRRWIMSDLGRFAIHTSRKRLIELQRTLHNKGKPYRAFDVYNLGRYERQWWQKDRLKGAEEEHRRIVLEFFRAEVLCNAPNPLLHGRKAGAFCHVDGIDSVFSREEARALARAVKEAGGREAYCLAWEFEMELRQYCLSLEAEFGVKLKLVPIPREIMEKNRKNPPPFLEMAVLEAKPVKRKTEGRTTVDVKLEKFLPSLAEVPSKELQALKERAVKHGMDFIDFWAVDFDWRPGQPFHHDWQDYRTRKDRTLKTVSDAGHVYDKPGTYTICVKVVDVFGCDTSIALEVRV